MRLTLDIDGRDWYAWGIFYSLRDSGLFWRVEIWRTRKGHHIVAFGGLTEREVMELRRTLGDDPVRIAIDEVKHPRMPKNVLFNVKNGFEAQLLEVWEDVDGRV